MSAGTSAGSLSLTTEEQGRAPSASVGVCPKVARMVELKNWLKSIGSCPACAMYMAIAMVDKEIGAVPATVDRLSCKFKDKDKCEGRARSMWNERPKVKR